MRKVRHICWILNYIKHTISKFEAHFPSYPKTASSTSKENILSTVLFFRLGIEPWNCSLTINNTFTIHPIHAIRVCVALPRRFFLIFSSTHSSLWPCSERNQARLIRIDCARSENLAVKAEIYYYHFLLSKTSPRRKLRKFIFT